MRTILPLEADDLCIVCSFSPFLAYPTMIKVRWPKKEKKKLKKDEYAIVTRIEGVAKVIEMLNGARILRIYRN